MVCCGVAIGKRIIINSYTQNTTFQHITFGDGDCVVVLPGHHRLWLSTDMAPDVAVFVQRGVLEERGIVKCDGLCNVDDEEKKEDEDKKKEEEKKEEEEEKKEGK